MREINKIPPELWKTSRATNFNTYFPGEDEAKDLNPNPAIFETEPKEDVDLDIVPKLVNKSLKDKLEGEARELNFLPRLGSLPF